MDKGILSIGVKLSIGLLICFGMHFAIFSFTNFGDSFKSLNYSLESFYGFEFIFSIASLFALTGIKNSMPNNLGYVFLGLITLRLFASYLFARTGLDSEQVDEFFKYNFLLIVLIYLAGDAYIGYSILNKKVS